jgi:hypothetical protein
MPPQDALGSFFQPSDQPEMASLRKKERAVPFATPRPTGGFVFSTLRICRIWLRGAKSPSGVFSIAPAVGSFFQLAIKSAFWLRCAIQWLTLNSAFPPLGSFFQPSDQAGNGFVAQKRACGCLCTPRPTGGFVFSIGHQVRFLASLRNFNGRR